MGFSLYGIACNPPDDWNPPECPLCRTDPDELIDGEYKCVNCGLGFRIVSSLTDPDMSDDSIIYDWDEYATA